MFYGGVFKTPPKFYDGVFSKNYGEPKYLTIFPKYSITDQGRRKLFNIEGAKSKKGTLS